MSSSPVSFGLASVRPQRYTDEPADRRRIAVMSLNSLLLTLALATGLFAADAYWNADTVSVDIHVPGALQATDASITGAMAESIFLDEIETVLDRRSLASEPGLRAFADETVVSRLASLLTLNNLTFAVQSVLGLEPARLKGAVLREPNGRLRFLLVSHHKSGRLEPVEVDLTAESGESISQLLRRGAVATLLKIDPYLTSLSLIDRIREGRLGRYRPLLAAPPEASDAGALAHRIEDLLARLPEVPSMASARARFENLLGQLALAQQDPVQAERHYGRALALEPGFFIAHLNRAFVRLRQDRYRDAIDILTAALTPTPDTTEPVLLAAAYTSWGVALRGLGRPQEAAAKFRRATETDPQTPTGFTAWGRMLTAEGRTAEGETLETRAQELAIRSETYPEVAILTFRLTQ